MPGSKTDFGENAVLNVLFGASVTAPTNWYLAAHVVSKWRPNQAYTAGTFVYPSSGTPKRLYRCTTAGTTGSSEPNWPDTADATVNDGTVVWTEATSALEAGTFPPEVSGNGYSRVTIANNTTNWPAATGGVKRNANAIVFPQATGDWGVIGLFVFRDASSGGNAWFYVIPENFREILSGDELRIPANWLSIYED